MSVEQLEEFSCRLNNDSYRKMLFHCAANYPVFTYKFDLCSKFETPEGYANDLTQKVLSYRICFKEELLGMTDTLKKSNSARHFQTPS